MRAHTARVLAIALLIAGCSGEPGSTNAESEDLRSIPSEDGGRDTAGRDDPPGSDTGGGDLASDGPGDDAPLADTAAGDAADDLAADRGGDADQTGLDDTATGEDLGGSCYAESGPWTGTRLVDLNEDPLEVGDRVRITIEVGLDGPAPAGAGILRVESENLRLVEGTLQRDGTDVVGATIAGGHVDVPLPAFAPTTVTLEAESISDGELVLVRADLFSEADGCTVNRSASGAMLQVLGGVYKISTCFDMRQTRSLQVAPLIRQRSTSEYLAANGARSELLADEFIFCPQSPTIVHATEFCLQSAPGQAVSLSGSYEREGDWEVDDFLLVEVFDGRGAREVDAITAQTHSGGDTFWCGAISSLMCTEGCQSEVREIEGGRVIPDLAVVSSQGARPRRFDDGAVSLNPLLPEDGSGRFVRFTALDVGEVGTLQPDLYVVSDPP